MTNVVSLISREPVKVETIDDHINNINNVLAENPGINKCFTVLIDEVAGTWQLHPIYNNMINGEVFMALRLM